MTLSMLRGVLRSTEYLSTVVQLSLLLLFLEDEVEIKTKELRLFFIVRRDSLMRNK